MFAEISIEAVADLASQPGSVLSGSVFLVETESTKLLAKKPSTVHNKVVQMLLGRRRGKNQGGTTKIIKRQPIYNISIYDMHKRFRQARSARSYRRRRTTRTPSGATSSTTRFGTWSRSSSRRVIACIGAWSHVKPIYVPCAYVHIYIKHHIFMWKTRFLQVCFDMHTQKAVDKLSEFSLNVDPATSSLEDMCTCEYLGRTWASTFGFLSKCMYKEFFLHA